jgi:hypothetical protein
MCELRAPGVSLGKLRHSNKKEPRRTIRRGSHFYGRRVLSGCGSECGRVFFIRACRNVEITLFERRFIFIR